MIDLSTMRFGVGTHRSSAAPTGNRDMCIMEAVAFMAGEPWSDEPECACPVISRLLREWNDLLSDKDRDRLLPAAKWVPKLIGSRHKDVEKRRAFMMLDSLIRTCTPMWFELVPELRADAENLRSLPELTDSVTASNAGAIGRVAYMRVQDINSVKRAISTDVAWDLAFNRAWVAVNCGGYIPMRECVLNTLYIKDRKGSLIASEAVPMAARIASINRVNLHPTVKRQEDHLLDLLERMLACEEPFQAENPDA